MDSVDSNGDQNGDNPRRLTFNLDTFDDNPSFSPNGRKIVFESGRDGNSNIYMMDAVDSDNDSNGDHLKRLTKNPADDEEPAFSASGTKIAIASARVTPDNPDGNMEIYVMKAKPEGRKNRPKNLTKNAAFDTEPSFSPDGTKIVFTRDLNNDGDENIYMMNVDGTGLTQLTSNTAFDSNPSFSPDGKQIVFRSGRNDNGNDPSEVYVMNAAPEDPTTNPPQNISKDSVASDINPAFSPDGTKVVFSSSRTEPHREIFIIDADGSGNGLTQLTSNTAADNRPDWGVVPT